MRAGLSTVCRADDLNDYCSESACKSTHAGGKLSVNQDCLDTQSNLSCLDT